MYFCPIIIIAFLPLGWRIWSLRRAAVQLQMMSFSGYIKSSFTKILQFWIVSVVIQHFSDSTVNLLSTQLSLWPLSETFSIQIVQKKTVLKSDFNWLGTQINSIFKSNFVNWRDFPIWWEYFSCFLCHWSGVLQIWIVLYCYIKDVTVMRWFESFCVVLLWWF